MRTLVPQSEDSTITLAMGPVQILSDTRGLLNAEWSHVWYETVREGVHGRYGTYNRGCRCEDCTAAQRAYRRALRLRHKAAQ